MVTLDQFVNGIMAYYETEIAQKASGAGKFAAYFAMPAIPNLVREKAEKLRNSPLIEGLMNADGLIDLETVRDRAAQAMQHCGSIDIMGFRLGPADVELLYDKIRRA